MELAAILAAGLEDWIDFGVICGILLLNAFVGWYQEKQAADVVASLKGDIAMRATVVRDGAEVTILAREIVPGDIVRLSICAQSDWMLIISRLSLRRVRPSPPISVLSATTPALRTLPCTWR